MLIKIKRSSDASEAEVTSKSTYLNRRQFIGQTGALALAAGSSSALAIQTHDGRSRSTQSPDWLQNKVGLAKETRWGKDETPAPYRAITTYNNFYEFGLDKSDPARYAKTLQTDPWSVKISGACEAPGILTLEDILKPVSLEERIYRLRCVEAWSMVIPWIGFPLADLIKRCKPLSNAKYVEFETLLDPKQMPEQNSRFSTIKWPYREGLRIDEATHPLTLMAVGLYGEVLPKQNGAPLRLVVPWKYGFKSIKSIVGIRFSETVPRTSWNDIAPHEYGFYANVNPTVDHPRWSQGSERRLPSGLFSPNRIDTQMFNGYDDVASLYTGMDLKKYY